MKKINEVSKLAGVSRRALQYYDDEGLLPVNRSCDNYRLYDDVAIENLWHVLIYREMGFELEEIKTLKNSNAETVEILLKKMIVKIETEKSLLDQRIALIEDVAQNGFPPVGLGVDGEEQGISFVEIIGDYKKQLMDKDPQKIK